MEPWRLGGGPRMFWIFWILVILVAMQNVKPLEVKGQTPPYHIAVDGPYLLLKWCCPILSYLFASPGVIIVKRLDQVLIKALAALEGVLLRLQMSVELEDSSHFTNPQ
ncbi:hypothetical protein CAPTEDRAFT_211046 [Capitella teleta]|uniref:Uncharacterized protein n=1 Tax=Capitella teleta TaxID=283909 RepID=R7VG02_CAPTE|nr:hypothetical protein CAPTEDRAFT_211046 [Capitella teleta]|eukprot:ELU14610.1 hypothetical protein CAPTEDRAFT_211046 [Capitella teleta]